MKNLVLIVLLGLAFACESPQNSEKVNQDVSKEETSEKQENKTDKKKDRKTKDDSSEKEGNASNETLKELGFPTGNKGEVLTYTGFTLCYNETHEQAAWVTYELTGKEVKSNNAERENDFREDPAVSTGSAVPADYKNSGYDRGHLAPAADMKFSKKAMSESFLLSNISPQDKDLNRELWRMLEEKTRDWAVRDKNLIIVTGGILKGNLKKIGKKNQISVPKNYYKILLDYKNNKAIAFIMPNKECTKEMDYYAVSIDKVEEETGLNFFPKLDSKAEKQVEATFDTKLWFD